MKKRKIDKINLIYNLLILLLFLLYLLRIIGIDKDLPNFGISLYQSVDEGIYSRMTLNFYNSKSLFQSGQFALYTLPFLRTNVVVSIFQYLFMTLFGDNYYGFRFVSIVINFLILVYIYKSIKLICIKNNVKDIQRKIITLIALTIIVSDFQFLLSSRVIENSNIRALILLILVYYFIKFKEKTKVAYYLYGLISVFSIFLVYFSNLFILLPIGIIFIINIINKKYKEAFFKLKYFFYGGFTSFFVAEIYYNLLWKSSAMNNFLSTIFNFSSRIGEGTHKSLLENMLNNLFWFFGSNIFFYSVTFLFIAMLSIRHIIRKNKTSFNLDEVFPVLFILSMILQSVFARDYIERKALTIYPMLILCIVYFAIDFIKYGSYKEIIAKEKIKFPILKDIVFYLLFFLCVYFGFKLRQENSYFYDYEFQDIKVLKISTSLQLIIIFLYLFSQYFKININMIRKIILSIAGIACITTNLYFSINYVYCFNKTTDKEAMIKIGEYCGTNRILGARSYGYTLYNNIRPIVNDYSYYREYIKSEQIKYQIEYSNTNNSEYLNKVIYGKENEQTVYLIQSYFRSEKAFGLNYDIGLFLKNDRVVYEKK